MLYLFGLKFTRKTFDILIEAAFLVSFILKNISLKKLILGRKWYNYYTTRPAS